MAAGQGHLQPDDGDVDHQQINEYDFPTEGSSAILTKILPWRFSIQVIFCVKMNVFNQTIRHKLTNPF